MFRKRRHHPEEGKVKNEVGIALPADEVKAGVVDAPAPKGAREEGEHDVRTVLLVNLARIQEVTPFLLRSVVDCIYCTSSTMGLSERITLVDTVTLRSLQTRIESGPSRERRRGREGKRLRPLVGPAADHRRARRTTK